MSQLTQQRLKEIFYYDPASGAFQRLKGKKKVGTYDRDGYVKIRVDGKCYRLHRIAWLYIYGELPKNEIDHIDGNRANNSINNLRDVDRSTNQQNQRKARKDNISGLIGVTYCKDIDKYKSRIKIKGATKHLGLFNSSHEAHDAYLKAKRLYHAGGVL